MFHSIVKGNWNILLHASSAHFIVRLFGIQFRLWFNKGRDTRKEQSCIIRVNLSVVLVFSDSDRQLISLFILSKNVKSQFYIHKLFRMRKKRYFPVSFHLLNTRPTLILIDVWYHEQTAADKMSIIANTVCVNTVERNYLSQLRH